MAQKLEAVQGGGGSIRLGTTGTIGTLMTRELDFMKSAAETRASSRGKPKSIPVSVSCGVNTAKRLQARKSLDEASSSSSSNNNINIKRQSPETETPRKEKGYRKSTHRVLGAEYISLDRTPSRVKSDKKATNIVEIVDIKCGNPDRAWASPITSKLKKLGFSKLSESMI
ncbi:hypothetical protein Tsubulata_003303 [Turnera subulata]|uniref:Uncharacterized protein n=1 Tax=Turnera subulata TaxID=218843 RepID=A0A9Q0FBL5_9ROSI|nr:hypothetical protein Tsubulata_003303 [Turnera subulata]